MNKINSAEFLVSNTDYKKCPKPVYPEFAFIGRSNVGKSSLINMICENKSLAKTSARPGKTKLINHFIINKKWYLVDLPGYGYAKVSKKEKEGFNKLIHNYIEYRENLKCLFILIDSRLEAQRIDLAFISWCAEHEVPFSLVFTKSDKPGKAELSSKIAAYEKLLRVYFAELPNIFITSSEKKTGRNELLEFMELLIK